MHIQDRYNAGARDFRGADLARANLEGVNLAGADLTDADLRGAKLARANLVGANLEGAYLSRANLTRANLHGANLHGANLSYAYLHGADLAGTDLAGTDLSYANLHGADLTGADLPLPDGHDPIALRLAIAAHLDKRPELHNQKEWGSGTNEPDCQTPCCVAGWACHLGGGEQGLGVQTAAYLLLWSSGHPMPDFHAYATRDQILGALRG